MKEGRKEIDRISVMEPQFGEKIPSIWPKPKFLVKHKLNTVYKILQLFFLVTTKWGG